jgi:hypothetical protein
MKFDLGLKKIFTIIQFIQTRIKKRDGEKVKVA